MSVLKRPEGETLSTEERKINLFKNFPMLLFNILILNWLVIFSSASQKSIKQISTMSSETFAQIRSLSLNLPDPVRADRAMHNLLCTNIKLARRVQTKNVLMSILKLNIGTNDVERFAFVVSKQNVKKVRNVNLINYTMKTKVCDAEFDEKNTRKEFIRKSIEYGRLTIRGSVFDEEFRRLMKIEVEKVWNEGKMKNKQKIQYLMSKYGPDKQSDDIRDVAYSDAKLETCVVSSDIDVGLYGDVNLNEIEKTALKMNPRFMTYPKIDEIEVEVEIEKGCTKARYQFMNEDKNETAKDGENNNTSATDDNFMVLDLENKTADYANIRATNIPTCQRIYPPKPATIRREVIMQNIKDKMLNKVKEYRERVVMKRAGLRNPISTKFRRKD